MKTISILLTVLACSSIILATNLKTNEAEAFSRRPPQASPFEKTDGYKRIDLRLREAWSQAIHTGNDTRYLECIAKTAYPMSKDEKRQLEKAGFKYRNVINTIVTGRLMAKDLPRVANLYFIQAMELAVPMSFK